ncbi:MAG: hypothetical protein IKK93_11925 [Campylobacter sp.]|nr:hypothetical protein [Campylobacter sp.]
MNNNITNKELAEWLAQGKGEWKHEPSNSGKIYDFYRFDPKDADKRITINEEGRRIVVRKYGDSEWHSPTEYYIIKVSETTLLWNNNVDYKILHNWTNTSAIIL